MRELKPRAWIERYKKYMPISLIDFESISGKIVSIEVVATGGDWCKFYPEEFILELPTGLKDKFGTEIYEGDICKCSFGECGVVNYRYGEFCIVGDDIVGMSLWKEKAFEIIGNIHKNPELLEEEE